MLDLISIIIPVYNVEKYLKRCIDSVILSSYKNIEIILVDDGSTDISGSICDEYEKNEQRVLVIHQSNKGVSAARNVGLKKATGDYVMFLDSDDELLPNAVEVLLNKIKKLNADMAVGGVIYSNGKSEETVKESECLIKDTDLLEKALEDSPYTYYVWRILYKKSFIEGLFFEEGRICSEDSYFVFQCALRKPRVVITNENVYKYYDNSTSTTHTIFSKKKYNDILYFLNKRIEIIEYEYPELANKLNNLIVKTNIMLLQNFCKIPLASWKKEEKKSLQTILKYKKDFVALSKDNKKYFFIITHHLYYLYKIYQLIKKKCNKEK